MTHRCHLRSVPRTTIGQFRQTATVGEHKAHVRHLRSIKVCYVQVCQRRTVLEHSLHVRGSRRTEVTQVQRGHRGAVLEHVAEVFHHRIGPAIHTDRSQLVAVPEHLLRTGQARRVPAGQVHCFQLFALIEKPVQFLHFRHVPTTQVDVGQPDATAEETAHVGHLARVQVLKVRQLRQQYHAMEPASHVGGALTGKRGVEHHFLHVQRVGVHVHAEPWARIAIHVQLTNNFLVTITNPCVRRNQVVVVERHHIGGRVDDHVRHSSVCPCLANAQGQYT